MYMLIFTNTNVYVFFITNNKNTTHDQDRIDMQTKQKVAKSTF